MESKSTRSLLAIEALNFPGGDEELIDPPPHAEFPDPLLIPMPFFKKKNSQANNVQNSSSNISLIPEDVELVLVSEIETILGLLRKQAESNLKSATLSCESMAGPNFDCLSESFDKLHKNIKPEKFLSRANSISTNGSPLSSAVSPVSNGDSPPAEMSSANSQFFLLEKIKRNIELNEMRRSKNVPSLAPKKVQKSERIWSLLFGIVSATIEEKSYSDLLLSIFVFGIADYENPRRELWIKQLATVAIAVFEQEGLGFEAVKRFFFPLFFFLRAEHTIEIRLSACVQYKQLASHLLKKRNHKDYNLIKQDILNFLFPVSFSILTTDFGEMHVVDIIVEMSHFLSQAELLKHIFPVIITMSHDNKSHLNICAINLIEKLAFKFGRETCALYLTKEFSQLSDHTSNVLTVLARNFKNLCLCVGKKNFETELFPVFEKLTRNEFSEVRKNCLESFVTLTKCVSEKSIPRLQNIYVKLIDDKCPVVKNTAAALFGKFLICFRSRDISDLIVQQFVSLGATDVFIIVKSYALDFYLVAQTLGRDRWKEVHSLYLSFASNKNMFVREIAAVMIAKIAKLIGTELAESHLFSIFMDFFLDDGKIKTVAMKGFVEFMTVIGSDIRYEMSYVFVDAVKNSNTFWRVRLYAVKQFVQFIRLSQIEKIKKNMLIVFSLLLEDSVFKVRIEFAKVIGEILNILIEEKQAESFILVEKQLHFLAQSNNFNQRQLYIRICENLMKQITKELFDESFSSLLFSLSSDNTINVRITIATLFKKNFNLIQKNEYVGWKKAFEKLKADSCYDVCSQLKEIL